MRKSNPKRRIEAIKANLKKAKSYTGKFLEDVAYQEEIAEAITPYWDNIGVIPSTGAVASTASSLDLWAQQSERMSADAESLAKYATFASSVATNIGSSTGTLSQFEPSFLPVSEKVLNVASKKLDRERIAQALAKIAPSLADKFHTIWQYTSIPAFDPWRGPLVQMRQVFDDFLAGMAPDNEVMIQPNFVPNSDLKKKNGKGVTNGHRIQYLANEKIKDELNRRAVINSSQTFIQMYKDLNRLHTPDTIDDMTVKNALNEGQALLQLWLEALELLP